MSIVPVACRNLDAISLTAFKVKSQKSKKASFDLALENSS